jgi:hypothetical protein
MGRESIDSRPVVSRLRPHGTGSEYRHLMLPCNKMDRSSDIDCSLAVFFVYYILLSCTSEFCGRL